MAGFMQWENQIGRRLQLRDLRASSQWWSPATGRAKLGVSTPSISEVIAGVEPSACASSIELRATAARNVEYTFKTAWDVVMLCIVLPFNRPFNAVTERLPARSPSVSSDGLLLHGDIRYD